MNKTSDIKPVISLIIPCYNACNYLDNCINSLINQKSKLITNNKLEIILVNDASTDNNKTYDKCEKIASENSNIKLLHLKENHGQANARNKGLEIAQGEYIGFVDADDVVDSSLFSIIEKALDKHPDVDVILWGLTELHYDSELNIAKKIDVIPKPGYYFSKKDILVESLKLEEKTLLGYLWNKLYKKEIIDKYKLKVPQEHLVEDILFNVSFFKHANTLLCIDKSMYEYARRLSNQNSVTSSELNDYFNQYYKRIESLYKWYLDEDFMCDNTKTILATIYVRYAISAVWRNMEKNMSKKEQAKWLNNFFELPLSINLIKYAKPNGLIAKINSLFFKHKNKKLILLEGKIIKFVTANMSKTLIKVRQSR